MIGQDSTGAQRKVRTDASGHLDIVGAVDATVDTSLLATAAKQDAVSTLLDAALALIASRLAAEPIDANDFGTVTKVLITAASVKLVSFIVTNNELATYFYQLHHKATPPAPGDVPRLSFQMPAGSMLGIGTDILPGGGLPFPLGLGWAWSSTAGTFTDAGTASLHSTAVLYTI